MRRVILAILAAVLLSFGLPTGDANGDGRVNSADLTMMRRHQLGTYHMTAIERCDIDRNGRIDDYDIATVRAIILRRAP